MSWEPSMSSEWKATALWKAIEKREGAEEDSVRAFLASCMPKIESILAPADPPSAEITLHDAAHAFRVAQTMARVVPADVFERLSIQELALLLLSAYLHGIGMSAERHPASSHYDYLVAGKPLGLSPREAEELQAWLDGEADGATPPAAPAPLTVDALRRALRLTALYCRAKHGEWGESRLRENDSWFDGGPYLAWTDALLRLCRHLQGYEELAGASFGPKPTETPGRTVRLRYLAAILRAADVLEFHP